jgi:hypothetical protein
VNETREVLHRVAAHVLGRRRFEVSGRFGLRASPGGFATPAFGPEPEVVRLSGGLLVREVGNGASVVAVGGSSLRTLAAFAGTDIDREFSCGPDTPAAGDVEAPLRFDPTEAARLASWWALGWEVLDRVPADSPGITDPATVQLWPEHFDAATTVTAAPGEKVNLGFSAGDGFSEQPYLYIGPWSAARPGDPGYWNAPFGAVLGYDRVAAEADPAATCLSFIRTGIAYVSLGTPAG